MMTHTSYLVIVINFQSLLLFSSVLRFKLLCFGGEMQSLSLCSTNIYWVLTQCRAFLWTITNVTALQEPWLQGVRMHNQAWQESSYRPSRAHPNYSCCLRVPKRGVCWGGGLGRNGVRESSIEGGDLKSTRGRRGRPRVKSGGHPKGEDLWLVEQRDGRNESEVSLWLLGQGIYIWPKGILTGSECRLSLSEIFLFLSLSHLESSLNKWCWERHGGCIIYFIACELCPIHWETGVLPSARSLLPSSSVAWLWWKPLLLPFGGLWQSHSSVFLSPQIDFTADQIEGES